MKLQSFTADNTENTRRQTPTIRLCRKQPNTINKAAVSMMQLDEGALIGLHQDEENKTDWYISLAEGGFATRVSDSGVTIFSNRTIADKVLSSLDIKDEWAAFKIGNKPVEIDEVEYWPLITLKPTLPKNGK